MLLGSGLSVNALADEQHADPQAAAAVEEPEADGGANAGQETAESKSTGTAGSETDAQSGQETPGRDPAEAAPAEDTADANVAEAVSAAKPADEDVNEAAPAADAAEEELPETASAAKPAVPQEETADPLDLSSYIKRASISYTDSQTKEKVAITDGTVIPDSAESFEITAEFEGLPSQELISSHDHSVFYRVSSPLTNPSVAGDVVLDENNRTVGTIHAADGVITIQFTNEHLRDADSTKGSFTFSCGIDRSAASENPVQIRIGDAELILNFQTHETAETGELTVQKSDPTYVSDETDPANSGYLEYTLTVQTGSDAMPNVSVKDTVTSGGAYVDGYAINGALLKEGKTASAYAAENKDTAGTVSVEGKRPGTMTWTVGDMVAHTTKYLTYRIKLNANYVGLYNKNALTNKAVSYASSGETTYEHGSDTSRFAPKEGAEVTKTASPVRDDPAANTLTIHYTVKIQAHNDNTWPIRNVKINDHLQNSYNTLSADEQAAVRNALCKYAKFEHFALYNVDENGDTTKIDIPKRAGNNPDTYYDAQAGGRNWQYNPSFDMYVGDVAPGEAHVIEYDLVINKTLFTTRSGAWTIRNSVSAHTDETKPDYDGGNADVSSGSGSKTRTSTSLDTQVWDRKIQGQSTTEVVTQQPSGMSAESIPQGAIQYKVVVNEAGKWNVASALFTDQLGNHLQYAGYLQIDYYADGLTFSEASNSVQSGTLTRTVYKKIDDIDNEAHTSFSFTPASIGLSEGKGAYVLTYYAVPADIDQMSKFEASNSFSLSGTVYGPGGSGKAISMAGAGSIVRTSKIVSGGSSFTAEKSPWYFDSASGKAYWVIEAGGDELPEGLALKDTPGQYNTSPALAGAYVGSGLTGGGFAGAYRNLSAFQNQKPSDFETLTSGTDYDWADNTFTLRHDLALSDGQKLYVIISTDRSGLSGNNKRDRRELKNTLSVKQVGEEDFRDENTASLMTTEGGDVFKELGQVIQFDGTNWTVVTSGKSSGASNIVTSGITDPGTYIEWRIKINMYPHLSGEYELTDTLPEGVEPVYVRYFWINPSLSGNAPTMPAISGMTGKNIGLGDGTHEAFAYYDAASHKIRFHVGNLQSELPKDYASHYDDHSLEIQVLVKVTDQECLMGTRKTFVNQISAKETGENGAEIGNDTSAATVKKQTLTKAAISTNPRQVMRNGVVPFTLTVNPLGEDLAEGAETLTLVDELAEPLFFDLDSIRVNGSPLSESGVTVQDGGRTEDGASNMLHFTVPNRQKLTITYNAVPYVQPNQTFRLSNRAYWSGYSENAASTVMENALNAVSATSSSNVPASLEVTKRDAEELLKLLPGAEFSLQKVTLADDGKTWVSAEEAVKTGTTDENGKVTFGSLEFNTPYCLTETKAPERYALDSTPVYVVLARNTSGTNDHPVYPDAVETYASAGAVVKYSGTIFSVDVADTPETEPEPEPEPATHTVSLTKVDTQSGKTLQGAVFALYNADGTNIGTYTTDENGLISVTGLADGSYYFTETEAPEGYVKPADDSTPFTLAADTGDYRIEIGNTRESVTEYVEINGEKSWEDQENADGSRPDTVTLHLLAGGREVGTVQASAADGWKYSFGRQPLTDADGDRIVYSITEDSVDGYTFSQQDPVSGNGTITINVTNKKEQNTPKDEEHPQKPEAPADDQQVPQKPEAPADDQQVPQKPEVPADDQQVSQKPEVPTDDQQTPQKPGAPTDSQQTLRSPSGSESGYVHKSGAETGDRTDLRRYEWMLLLAAAAIALLTVRRKRKHD